MKLRATDVSHDDDWWEADVVDITVIASLLDRSPSIIIQSPTPTSLTSSPAFFLLYRTPVQVNTACHIDAFIAQLLLHVVVVVVVTVNVAIGKFGCAAVRVSSPFVVRTPVMLRLGESQR
jgi:hypothetical protein